MENVGMIRDGRQKLPTFIVVGAARSGTTTLYHLLRQHPEIYMSPVKETNYFVNELIGRNGPGDRQAIPDVDLMMADILVKEGRFLHAGLVRDLCTYLRLFDGTRAEKVRGEISPSYLYYSKVASERIKQVVPDIKIIILLRNPIERAFSNYKVLYTSGREDLDISTAMCRDVVEKRLHNRWEHFWDYLGLGKYAEQVKTFLDTFGSNKVGIWLYEDFRRNPQVVFEEICEFIGASPITLTNNKAWNASKKRVWAVKHKVKRMPGFSYLKLIVPSPFRRWVSEYLDAKLGVALEMPIELRKHLFHYYKEDILALDRLLPHLHVTRWLEDEERKLQNA